MNDILIDCRVEWTGNSDRQEKCRRLRLEFWVPSKAADGTALHSRNPFQE